MEQVLEILGVAGPALTGVIFGGAVLALFWKGDDAISEEARKALSGLLLRLQPPEAPADWPATFIAMFDRLFGQKHLSWRCFGMSSLASLIAFTIMALIYYTTGLGQLPPGSWLAAYIFLLPIVYNLIPDYVSLLETRLVLKKLQSPKPHTTVALWLVFDVLATTVIFWVPFFGIFVMVPGIWTSSIPLSVFGSVFVNSWTLSLPPGGEGISAGLPLYTTFFTSFWIWIYVGSRVAVRALTAFGPILRALQWALPLKTKPMRSVGQVAAVFCCAGYWIVAWMIGAPDPVPPAL